MNEYNFYITSNTTFSGGDYCEGEEGPYGVREPRHLDTVFTAVYAKHPPQMFYETIEVSEQEYDKLYLNNDLYLSVIFYRDGDSFGTTYGCHELIGLSTSLEEAKIKNNNALNRDYKYKPWEGYFCELIGAEIHLLRLIK